MKHTIVPAPILCALLTIVLAAAATPVAAAAGGTAAPALTAQALPAAARPLGAAPFTSPDGLWTWSRPLPFGYHGLSIAATAPGTLFVATSEPDLLMTTDGGATWSWDPVSSVPGFVPRGVAFASAAGGWVWSGDGSGQPLAVARTTDGGASWDSSLAIPAGLSGWLDLRTAGPDAAWVVASPTGGVEYDSCLLYHTTDGGQTWSSPVVLPQDDFTTFSAVAPAGSGLVLVETLWSSGAGNGDIVGSRILRTTDGGVTWSAPITLKGADIGDAAFTTASKGWATDDSWLWGTTDGGVHWHKVRPAPSADHLVVTGDGIWAIPSLMASYALHSTNNGATWHEVAGMAGVRLSFADPHDGWVVRVRASTRPALRSWLGLYQHTTDGGATWRTVVDANRTEVTSLAAPSGNVVWAAADFVMRSADAGRTWKRVTRRGYLSAVAAVSGRRAWAVGQRGMIVRTTDAGSHWTLQPSGVSSTLRDVVFADAAHGWASGDDGVLLRTADGGRHWAAKHFGKGAAVRSLTFADALHGLALRGYAHGQILRTSDGGRHWAIAYLPDKKVGANAVTMLDATHAVMTTRGPGLYADVWLTSDGGATWQVGNRLPDPGPMSLSGYEAMTHAGSTVCAVSRYGGVVTSPDGGVTWSYLGAPSGMRLDDVRFVGDHTLMVAGQGVLTRDLTVAPLP